MMGLNQSLLIINNGAIKIIIMVLPTIRKVIEFIFVVIIGRTMYCVVETITLAQHCGTQGGVFRT